jgi:hypothetical protein
MADEINTGAFSGAGDSTPRELHPADTVLMQCVDIVNLGVKPESYLGKDKGLKAKCAIVFRSTEKREDGSHFDLSREFTVFTGPKGSLRGFLEGWRGQPYTEEYPDIPLHKMVGVWAMATVVHKPSKDGTRTYANLGTVTPVPKALRGSLPELPAYERAEWWTKRQGEYAEEAAAYRAAHAAPESKPKAAPHNDFAPPELAEPDEEDDLPFD